MRPRLHLADFPMRLSFEAKYARESERRFNGNLTKSEMAKQAPEFPDLVGD